MAKSSQSVEQQIAIVEAARAEGRLSDCRAGAMVRSIRENAE